MSIQTKGSTTTCVHAGTVHDSISGGVNTPIYPSTSFRKLEKNGSSYCYPRYMNVPTQLAAANKVATLEGSKDAIVVSSGMAAITISLLSFLAPGDHIILQAQLYGGTYYFLTTELARWGVTWTLVHNTDPEALAGAIRKNTRVLYVESPTNPLLHILNLAAIAQATAGSGVTLMIDNTFATPMNQRPLDLGFHISIHSGTKYLAGHSDLQCGAVASDVSRMAAIRNTATNYGSTLNVYDCYLLERSMKTLSLRMDRHNENAQAVAQFLAGHPKVEKIFYPGLPSHPGHAIAARQMNGFGGIVSFQPRFTLTELERFLGQIKLITPAISLGGVESLLCVPALTSHLKVPRENRLAMGITDTLVRVSVGIEDASDIIADLEQALSG
ncbi:Cystathionine gamma-lyase [Desulfovibrionales bacterium]